MELDICDLALLVDEGEGVHPKALHVAVVQGNAHIILQKGELQRHNISQLLLPLLATQKDTSMLLVAAFISRNFECKAGVLQK